MRSPAQAQRLCRYFAVVCAAVVSTVQPSSAQHQFELDAIGLIETFSDVTVQFQTPLGVVLPVRFHGNRTLSGHSGAIARHLGSATDYGRWWVDGPHLCQRWNIWFNAKTNCVKVFRGGDHFTWQGVDGKTGRGMIVRERMITQKKKRKLPAPSALGAPVPSLATPAGPTESESVGRYAQPLRDRRTVYRLAQRRDGRPVQVVAYPSQTSQVLGTLDERTQQMTGWGACSNGWCPVMFEGQHGWVQQKYVQRRRARLLPGQGGRGLRYRVSGVKSWDVLNVRRLPKASAGIVGQLRSDARNIKLTGVCRGLWCPIQIGGERGWVHSHYLAIQ